MLQHANSVSACGSVSFPRLAGEGRDGGQRAEDRGEGQPALSEAQTSNPARKIKPVYRLTLSPDASPAAPDNNPHWHNAVLRDYPK